MPFTFAHPAVAVPLRRRLGRWASLSGLVIGSMVPDLAHFLPVGVARAQSHSLAGLFWFCLPVGLAAYAVFHALLLPFAVALAPLPLARTITPQPRGGPTRARVAAVAVSILVGAITHLAWDAFTHDDGAAVRSFRVLSTRLPVLPGHSRPLYAILQHVSTLVGVSLLAFWSARWLSRPRRESSRVETRMPRLSSRERGFALAAVAIPALVAAVVAAWPYWEAGQRPVQALRASIGPALRGCGVVSLALLLAAAASVRLRSKPARAASALLAQRRRRPLTALRLAGRSFRSRVRRALPAEGGRPHPADPR